MLTEVQYRTFDQLLDSVKLDFESYDIENMISNQNLIKVAQKINSQLGLKINPSKTKVLELRSGKAKLPSDLYVLNFVLLCGEPTTYDIMSFPQLYGTYEQGVEEGTRQALTDLYARIVKQYTVIMDIVEGANVVTHNLGTTNVVIQAFGPTGNLLTFDVNVSNSNQIRIISESPITQENIKVIVLGSNSSYGVYCPAPGSLTCPPEPEIITIDTVPTCPTLRCNTSGCDTVAYSDKKTLKEYKNLTQLRLLTNKSTTVDEFNITSTHTDIATIKNGYLVTNLDEGDVFIHYQGQLEDEEGNLLVMDHPLVNDYYEYALKKHICENLIVRKEPVINLYNLIAGELRKAKIDAISYVRTPGFKELHKNWKMNRQAMYVKYYDAFKS